MLLILRREPMVLLHSKSGLGKSSLLNAGVIPRSEAELDMVPVPIRFRAWVDGRSESPLSVTKNQLRTALGEGESFLVDLVEGDDSLWQIAKDYQIRSGKRLLLLFDQFEELFTYPAHDVEDFQQEIDEVLNTGIPLRFYRKIESQEDLSLSEDVENVLYGDLNTHILFAIRSDRLAELESLKKYLPDVMRHSYELKALTRIDAEEAIVKPASTPGTFATPAFEYSDQVLTELLDFLEDDEECRVEGILLQMLCEHYERHYVEEQGILYLEEIGDPQAVVDNYYREKVRLLPENEIGRARKLIEDGLVSKGRGMRISLHEAFILQEYHVGADLLTKLEDKRLVRREPFSRGGYTYELSHDSLLPAVVKMREERLESEAQEQERRKREMERKQAIELREKLEKEAEIKERLSVRNRRIGLLLGLSMVLLVVSAFFYFDLRNQKQEVKNKAVEIEQKNTELRSEIRSRRVLQETNQRIIDAFYFYDDRLALAVKDFYGEKRYGYIDKSGRTVIPYGYTFATPFEETGFAKAKKKITVFIDEEIELPVDKEAAILISKNIASRKIPRDTLIDLLLDDKGNEYRVAYQRKDLDPSIDALELLGRGWKSVPSWVGGHRPLKVLFLSGADGQPNLYRSIPASLGNLDSLKHFSCRYGSLLELSSVVGNWKNLETIDLAENDLISLPAAITENTRIERFDLSGNRLFRLPDSIGNLTRLSQLLLRANYLERLPASFSDLQQLVELDLSFNPLERLPNNLSSLTRLKVLKLDGTALINFNSGNEIFELDSLVELSLSQNKYEWIPSEIGQLKMLERLDLSDNWFTKLPRGFSKLSELHTLDLSRNLIGVDMGMNEALEELGKISNLHTLDLGFNQLNEFNMHANWGALESLNLEQNKISELVVIGPTYKLKNLNLQGNEELAQLPAGIGSFTKLESLDLSNTAIRELPSTVQYLTELKFLDLRNTRIPIDSEEAIRKMLPQAEILFGAEITEQLQQQR